MTFHIKSLNGAYIYDYLGHQSFTEKETGKTVLFPSGSEFLICKVVKEEKENGKTEHHIYMRNICLGMSMQQTILWTDERSNQDHFVQCERMLNYRIKRNIELEDF